MALTSENLPKVQQGASVHVDPNDPFPNVTAKPLQSPDFCEMKAKNPLLAVRWCNRVAGEGQRLDQVTYAGFRPAKPDEIYLPSPKGPIPCPVSLIRDGKVIYGDLQLMIIDRAAYDGALKYNWERAVQRMHPKANKNEGDKQLANTLKEAGIRQTPELLKKLSTFQPSDAEIEAGEKASDRK